MNRLFLIGALALPAACSGDRVSSAASGADSSAGFIEGTVTSVGGPEAGVWIIAETGDLPTPYRKIVVTDDDGRFVLPQLPDAGYAVWVRGYGLADSDPVDARPGDTVELTAEAAADDVAAAQIYPASYWLSLMNPPDGDANWTSHFKLGCQLCHQVGSALTRFQDRELFDAGFRKATFMDAHATSLGRAEILEAMTDWTDRIRAGETPPAPPRPEGIERNVVITQWNWADGDGYIHDEIATDKRDPTLYPNGPVYGVDIGNDRLVALDPLTHTPSEWPIPTLGGFDTPWCNQTYRPLGSDQEYPSGLGSLGCPMPHGITIHEGKYPNPANPHNPMFDGEGRVWITTQIRRQWAEDAPEFCREAGPIAATTHHRQLGYFDPETGEFELIDTCFGTHHLQFDGDGVLWTSGDVLVFGWFDPSLYDPARPETLEAAQGFAPVVVDTDGDGEAETPVPGFNYGVIPNPVDGSVWASQPSGFAGSSREDRGRLIRYDPATGVFETYMPPLPGGGPRGVDVDTNGIIWAALGGSGHLGRFDRSRCARTWGPGDQCPEGWTLYRSPGPRMRTGDGPDEINADFHYYLFVDQFDTLGLGENVVVLNGTGSDALLAFDQETEEFTTIRIPYPLVSYTRGLDGRIDDPDAGWKGRGLWYTNGLDPIFQSEIPHPYVGKVQLRPDPLAR
ncbi:MAG: carboxypeptidase regulatory-like domain-containing protein [Gemmatimonadota bacterium]|nr:carboxypeptidase regulatory-like domain-containing protein [Gemmatimonadota bacterium]